MSAGADIACWMLLPTTGEVKSAESVDGMDATDRAVDSLLSPAMRLMGPEIVRCQRQIVNSQDVDQGRRHRKTWPERLLPVNCGKMESALL